MREFGIIYFTGDVLRVADDPQREEESANKWGRLPLNVVQMANYVVDLTTGQELKSRYINPDDYGIVNPHTREMFMNTPLSSVSEAIELTAYWQRRSHLEHIIKEKMTAETKHHTTECIKLVDEFNELWERTL